MDDKKYRFYDDEDYDDNSPSVNERIFLEIISQVPDGSYLYMGCYVDELLKDNRLPKLFECEIPISNDFGWYDKCFKLTSECKIYLEQNLSGNYLSFFCHYMIRDEEKVYVVVFDGCHFDIDASIKIPQNVIDECGREFEMDFSFSDPVTL